MLSSTIIPMPAGDRDFEEKCVVLFAGLLNDPNVKTVGVSGQGQKGLDLIGRRDRDPAQPVGVQCKLRTKGDKLKEKEVREEVEAALAVVPPLTEYYIVTTAPDDTAMDLLAVQLAQTAKVAGRTIDIQIWGWETLQQRIRSDPKALNAFDPGHSPVSDQLLRLGVEQIETTKSVGEGVVAAVERGFAQLTVTTTLAGADPGRRELDDHLHDEIDQLRDLIEGGQPRTALGLLQKLEARLGADHSAAVRGRVRSVIGVAYLRLGDQARAAEALIEAQVLDPEDRKIAANAGVGLLMLDRGEEAVAKARAALQADPTDAGAASLLLVAAATTDLLSDPMADVPVELLSDARVAANHINWLRNKGSAGAWREPARAAAAAHPDDQLLQRFAAEADLDQAITAAGPDGAFGFVKADFPVIRRAADTLAAIWDVVQGREDASESAWTSMARNLAVAWRVLGQNERAQAVLDRARALNPDDPGLKVSAAQSMMEAGRAAEGAALAESLPEGRDRTMLVLSGWSNARVPEKVIAWATPERREALDDADKADFDAMLVKAQAQVGQLADPAKSAQELVAAWPSSLPAHVIAADVAGRTDPETAEKFASTALGLLSDATGFGDRVMLAQLGVFREDPDTVIAALDGFVAVEHPSQPLSWLAWAFANGAPRPRTRQFFADLPPEVLAAPGYARFAGAAEAARGDLKEAERLLRAALDAEPDDLRASLLLASVLQRDDREAEAASYLVALDEKVQVGSAQDRMRLAFQLRRAGESARAFALGYATAAGRRDDAEVMALYPGLILFGDSTAVPPVDTAGSDFWFDLEGQDGADDVEGVVEAEPLSGISFAPDHPLARAIAGKSIGDVVELASAGDQVRRYRLRELKPKIVWLLHDIMRSHNTRFPDATNLIQVTIQGSDLGPMLKIVKAASEHDDELLRAYAESPLPLAAVAVMAGRNVIELADYLPIAGGEVRACVGSAEERAAAAAALRGAQGEGVAIDLLTAWTAFRLGLLPKLQEGFGRLLIPRSAVDTLMEMRSKVELNRGQESINVAYQNGEPVKNVHTAEHTESVFQTVSRGLEQIRACCEVLPTDGSEVLRLDGENFDRFAAGEVLDAAHLSINHQAPLLSDDLHMRQLAEQNGAPAGGWLQVGLNVFREAHALADTDYFLATAQLAGMRHGHVSLDAGILMGLARMPGQEGVRAFRAATTYLGGPRADLQSHLIVALQFLREVWDSDLPHHVQGRCTGRLLERLIDGRQDWRELLVRIERVIARLSREVPSFQGAEDYILGWIKGHFLLPELKG